MKTKISTSFSRDGVRRRAWSRRLTRAGVTVLLAFAPMAVGGGLAGQAPGAGTAEAKVGCLRGRPLPSCKSFWLVEMQGYTPLVQSTRPVSYGPGTPSDVQSFESNLEWNVGHMVNLTPTFALGGTLSIGPRGGSGIFTGAKLRARRWISPDWSLELVGGLLESGIRYPEARGVTFDVRVNVRDQGGFFVRWDGVSLAPETWQGNDYYDAGGFQQALSVGAVAGSVPALVGTGALGVGYLILLGVFLSNAD